MIHASAHKCSFQQLEPYYSQSNGADMNIRELNCGSSCEMIKKQSPKKLWDNCLELESLISSHTSHDHFPLIGEVPETLMKGTGSDINNICENEWYE